MAAVKRRLNTHIYEGYSGFTMIIRRSGDAECPIIISAGTMDESIDKTAHPLCLLFGREDRARWLPTGPGIQ